MAETPRVDKDSARERRLKASFTVEERIAKTWREQALQSCDDTVRAYWVCRQEAGFAVVFKCRSETSAMNECVKAHTNDKDKFEAYRDARLREMAVAAGRLPADAVLPPAAPAVSR